MREGRSPLLERTKPEAMTQASAFVMPHSKPGVRHGLDIVIALVCFLITLSSCLVENLFGDAPRTTFMFDARHYLESCRQLTMLWQQACTSHCFDLSKLISGRDPWFAEYLMLDGPILPILAVPIFAFLHKVPAQTDWRIFVSLGAFIQALSTIPVFLLAKTLTRKRTMGFFAALAWGLYPAAIWASGEYLTEAPTALLLVASVLCSWFLFKYLAPSAFWQSGEEDKPEAEAKLYLRCLLSGIAGGIINALLLLMKPAILPIWLAVLSLSFLLPYVLSSFGYKARQIHQQGIAAWSLCGEISRRLPMAIFGLVLGACFVFLPWLSFSKQMTGEYHLLPQRVPAFNLAKGFDLEADGWSCEPTPPVTDAITKSAHPLSDAMAVFKQEPMPTTNLFARKISRLWQAPWNDFRRPILGISVELQQWWHALICLLAILGSITIVARICLPASSPAFRIEPAQVFIGAAVVIAAIGHLIFLPFETISRYAFTSMPFLILLAFYYLSDLAFAFRAGKLAKHSLFAVILAVSAELLVLNCNLLAQIVSFSQNFKLAAWSGCLAQFVFYLLMLLACLRALKTLDWMLCVQPGNARARALSPMHGLMRAVFASYISLLVIVPAAMAFSFATDGHDLTSWSEQLEKGEVAQRAIDLSARPFNRSDVESAFLLIDADQSVQSARIVVNGQEIVSAPRPLYGLYKSHYYLLNLMRKYASAMGKSVDELGQWRIVPVALTQIDLKGVNTVSLAAKSGAAAEKANKVTVFGEYLSGCHTEKRLCDLDWFSPGRMCEKFDRLDGRLSGELVGDLSHERNRLFARGKESDYDLSHAPGKQFGRFRMFLVLGMKGNSEQSALAASKAAPQDAGAKKQDFEQAGKEASWQLLPALYDQVMRGHIDGSDVICINRKITQASSGNCYTLDVPAAVSAGNYIHLQIKGYCKGVSGKPGPSILPVLVSASKPPIVMTPPEVPPRLSAGNNWQPFLIESEVPVALLKGGLKNISVAIYPGRSEEIAEYGFDRATGEGFLKDISVSVRAVNNKFFPEPENRLIF